MIRKNFYITLEQDDFLQKHTDLTVSEHIRRAIDAYMQKFTPKSSTSPSKNVKKG